MPPKLMAMSEGLDILLDKPILLVGRHQECDIQISSRKISRKHCCIAQVNEYLVVRDLFSTNGIRINGVRVLEGELKTGDELTIANFRYKVFLRPEAEGDGGAESKPAAAEGPKRAQSTPDGDLHEHDPLESCEEPVPISESGGLNYLVGRQIEPPSPPSSPEPRQPSEEQLSRVHGSQEN